MRSRKVQHLREMMKVMQMLVVPPHKMVSGVKQNEKHDDRKQTAKASESKQRKAKV